MENTESTVSVTAFEKRVLLLFLFFFSSKQKHFFKKNRNIYHSMINSGMTRKVKKQIKKKNAVKSLFDKTKLLI